MMKRKVEPSRQGMGAQSTFTSQTYVASERELALRRVNFIDNLFAIIAVDESVSADGAS